MKRTGFLLLSLTAFCHATGVAANPIQNLKIPGVSGQPSSQAQSAIIAIMFINARDDLAGTNGLSEPWPCVNNTEAAVFIPNDVKAYERFRDSVVKQGYHLDKEMKGRTGDKTFQFSKGNVFIIGMWAKAFAGQQSTLVLCQRAVNWKPAPPPVAPAAATPLKNSKLTEKVSAWKLGERGLVAVAPINHDYYDESQDSETDFIEEDLSPDSEVLAVGKISADGTMNVTLPSGKAVPPKLLFPLGVVVLEQEEFSDDDRTCSKPDQLKMSAKAQGLSIGGLSITKPGFKGMDVKAAEAAIIDTSIQPLGSVNTRSQDSSRRLIYTDIAVTIKGAFSCKFDDEMTEIVEVNLNLPQGWSYIEKVESTGSAMDETNTMKTQIRNAPAATGSFWNLSK